MKSGEIRLGLDLQGGSYLLLKVESESLQTDRLNSLADELRLGMRNSSPRIGYKNLKVSGTELNFTLINQEDSLTIKDLLDSIDKEFIINIDNYNNVQVSMSEEKIKEISDYAILQSIEIIRRTTDMAVANLRLPMKSMVLLKSIINFPGLAVICIRLWHLDTNRKFIYFPPTINKINYRACHHNSGKH